jgi:gliding motility-associated-like protein
MEMLLNSYLWHVGGETFEDLIFLTAGWYPVTITDMGGCSYTDSVEVGFAEPVFYNYPLICEGSPIQDLNFVGANNGVWSGPGIVDANLGLFDPVVSGVGVFDIIFTSNLFCSENFTMNVVVDALPNVSFNSNVVGGCQTLDVLFSVADAGPNALYIWNFGDGSVSSDPVNTAYAYVNFGIYDVSLSITDSSGCSNSLTYPNYIEVFEHPVADFDFTPEEVDAIQSTVQFYNSSSAVADNFYWTFGDSGNSYVEDPLHEYTGPGYYQVKLHVSSVMGCLDTAITYIKYKEVIFMYIPNAFTPNGDGRNDVFQVKSKGEINLFSMKIFDRWGVLVFETKDINQPWVGNHMGGNYYLTTGVYSYIIEYEAWGAGLEEPIGEKFTGTVMLMK